MEFVKDHDPYPDLRVNIGSLELQNPVMTASGTFGYAREFEDLVNLHRLGGIIVKGISLEPRAGNPPQRIVETPCGMLNAIGLQNVGAERFIAELRKVTDLPVVQVIVTHYHADHIYGLQVFKDLGAEIIAPAGFREYLESDAAVSRLEERRLGRSGTRVMCELPCF